MKALALLPLAALASGWVVPEDNNAFAQKPLGQPARRRPFSSNFFEKFSGLGKLSDRFAKKPFRHVPESLASSSRDSVDDILSKIEEEQGGEDGRPFDPNRGSSFDFESWIDQAAQEPSEDDESFPAHFPGHRFPGFGDRKQTGGFLSKLKSLFGKGEEEQEESDDEWETVSRHSADSGFQSPFGMSPNRNSPFDRFPGRKGPFGQSPATRNPFHQTPSSGWKSRLGRTPSWRDGLGKGRFGKTPSWRGGLGKGRFGQTPSWKGGFGKGRLGRTPSWKGGFGKGRLGKPPGWRGRLGRRPSWKNPFHRLPRWKKPLHRVPHWKKPLHRVPHWKKPLHKVPFWKKPFHRLPFWKKPVHRTPHWKKPLHKPGFHARPPFGFRPHLPHHRIGKFPHRGGLHHKFRHHRHHGPIKVNMTIYELISKSNHTKHLAKLIDDDKDLVDLLSSTKANYTLYAPTDWAFKKLPKKLPKPSKDMISKVLSYHVSPGLYPTWRLWFSHTAPTLLESDALGGNPQRVLAKWFGFRKGFRLNYYNRVLLGNIHATNGIVHGMASILLPPPPTLSIISALPGSFSTLSLGLEKTGLVDSLNSTDKSGGTLFAPSNFAFKRLGPIINAFLFSKHGEKYLKALLQYHIVPDKTLYSTAFYDGGSKDGQSLFADGEEEKLESRDQEQQGEQVDEMQCAKPALPAEPFAVHATSPYAHLDLPTLLDGKPIAVDVVRRGPFVSIKLNGLNRVLVKDGLARDGVIHVVPRVLIPPKGKDDKDGKNIGDFFESGKMSVKELVTRLRPLMSDAPEELPEFDEEPDVDTEEPEVDPDVDGEDGEVDEGEGEAEVDDGETEDQGDADVPEEKEQEAQEAQEAQEETKLEF